MTVKKLTRKIKYLRPKLASPRVNTPDSWISVKAREAAALNFLMFPWLASGHLSTYAELANRLAHSCNKVWIFTTPFNIPKMGLPLLLDKPKLAGKNSNGGPSITGGGRNAS